ncbi:ABC-type glycerol-3-phosphate transport system substrate-binding protein [Paenibacillus baekrokdamisoli]|nr:extracellular solute-binding protein [Paenibacillus baekrokdamisoli]MBB3070892.1 ABC-type glycerol-3-phosphate transport system substrate-binding protein [Paenibacillus baekrokdamisoli]
MIRNSLWPLKRAVLALLLGLLLLSACQSDSSIDPATSPDPDGTAASLEAKNDEMVISAYQGTIYTGPKNGPSTEYAKYIKSRFNINVDRFVWSSGENIKKKISLFAASGEMPDIIQFGVGPGMLPDLQIPHEMADNGMLLNIEPYLNNSPNLMKYLTPTIIDSYRNPSNGKLYVLPNFAVNEQLIDELTIEVNNVFIVRADWLEKLHLEVPTTPEDFYEMLIAFKKMPDWNGQQVIPYMPFWRGAEIRSHIGAMFGIWKYRTAVDEEAQRMVDYHETKEYLSYLKYAARLYREGLIYPEAYKTDWEDAFYNYIPTPRVGLSNLRPGEITSMNTMLQKLDPKAKYVPMPLPKAPGVGNSEMERINRLGSSAIIISKKVSDPERLFHYLDWMASDEGWATVTFGPPSKENGSWYIDEMGQLIDNPELAAMKKAENPAWESDVLGAWQYGLSGVLKYTRNLILDQSGEPDPIRLLANKMYSSDVYMDISYDILQNLAPGPERAEKGAGLDKLFEEGEARIVMTSTSDADVTVMYEKMMKQAVEAGFLAILKEDYGRYQTVEKMLE